jgi:hypothetical protein
MIQRKLHQPNRNDCLRETVLIITVGVSFFGKNTGL